VRLGLATTALVLVSQALVSAHEGGSAAGLLSGLLHPISGFDHVLAMVAVGIWGAQLGQPAIWMLPVTFPVVMAFGGMLGLLGVPLPGVEIGIGLSALMLGLVVALERPLGLSLAAALVGFFAVFHGHAHGSELPDGQSGLLYSIGFVGSTGSLHALGIALGMIHRWKSGRLVLRLSGAVIGVAGLWFVWSAVSG